MSQVNAASFGIRATFLLVGVAFATWTAQLPSLKSAMSLSDGDLAWLLGGLNLGALLGLRMGAWLTSRFGSRGVLRTGMPLFALTLLCVALAPNVLSLGAALVLFGVANSVVDVAMNAHGILIERVRGRSVLSGFHAMHSLGMITGALVAALLLSVGVPTPVHMSAAALAVGIAGFIGTGLLYPSEQDKSTAPDRPRTSGAVQRVPGWSTSLLLLGAVAFLVALAEGAANDWATVYLHDVTQAAPSIAALGYASFSGAMFVGRLVGDKVIDAVGHVRALFFGGVVSAASLSVGLLVGTSTGGILGLTGFGFGVSYTLPLLISLGGRARGLDRTRSVANVSTIGYFGFFTGPTVIGFASETSSLGLAMAIPALSMTLAAVLAPPVIAVHRRHQASARETSAASGDVGLVEDLT